MNLSPIAQYILRSTLETEESGGVKWVSGAVGQPWMAELCPKYLTADVPTFLNSGPGAGAYLYLTQAGLEMAKTLPSALRLAGKLPGKCDAPDEGE